MNNILILSLTSPIEEAGSLVRVRTAPVRVLPDTEENVKEQSEAVFMNFLYQRHKNDSVKSDVDSTPPAPELSKFSSSPVTPAANIGRQLAKLGDEINDKYGDMLDGMIGRLDLNDSEEEAYDAFSCIAKSMFKEGTSWSRILMLLSFGYRMAINVLKTQAANFHNFLLKIVMFVCKFLVVEKIVNWIAEQGGWRAALNYCASASTSSFYMISGLALVSVLAVYALHKYLR